MSRKVTMTVSEQAGCDSYLYNRAIDVVRACKDPVGKIHYLNDFYERVARQHISSVLNKELRSSHTLYAVKYIEQCKHFVCDGLRDLVTEKLPSFMEPWDMYEETHPEYHPRHRRSRPR